ncbi:helix-turn-helix domain-containing protein [Microbulbifer sp. 2304DJ12-6]|uniref:helix-turn-helix domain-containing protein n=1 Tax=Microbulbifer sp. 2304DJ12-6 TaxID=3233340 RepID=UPI0039B00B4E
MVVVVSCLSGGSVGWYLQSDDYVGYHAVGKGVTQVLMAEKLDVSQQTINSYEVGRFAVPKKLEFDNHQDIYRSTASLNRLIY